MMPPKTVPKATALDGDAQAGLLGVAKGLSQSGLVVDGLGWHAMIP